MFPEFSPRLAQLRARDLQALAAPARATTPRPRPRLLSRLRAATIR